ncbi:amino acid adenylation domain-containing protein [Streptomyces griseus]|uniref:Phenyloxazoline synthase MbtB n=1 Tax=Streptomyces stephensoniae TaxID=3375367 RepID=A0ABU2VZR3_9ACTN|nr:non-ribosomal peptide synthetase/type I polyketide synthase [Streptomyces griseus]MDT0490377.1 amino acid adenylation domain-containing protein [Streptomyces griseus]
MVSEVPASGVHHDGPSVDIAVVGMAGRFPGAPDLDAYWHNLCSGTESVERLTEDELLAEGIGRDLIDAPGYVPVAPVLEGIELFDARFFGFTAREAALLDPQQRLFLESAWHAMEHAGIDPGRCGRAGVFAGGNMPAYLMSNLLGGARIVLDSTMFELQIHNDKDYLASRTAYKLGLTGPAVNVQTACSTSLVAVHQAAASLRSGACELALAGGVCVRVPHRVGYRYEQGLIYSPDGRCRPFDADGAGTVFGNGVGVVVLKRLADARRDGDRVLAVLKGSAVNNDGADKVGYTSPSVSGQEAVVAAAIADSGVPARSITAIEAHGTGTHVGDPIEITALTRAFGQHTSDTQFCAVSSVKSNIGHLESAAGIAGFIKAVLQLQHRTLVPSLHYRRPNPRIDFASTPFFVNAELREWPEGDSPRRIGVSSFGIGGTNAHVVLEQAPDPEPTPDRPSGGPELVVVSAKSPAALDAAAEALSERLTGLGGRPLADIAHTLQTGRTAMRYRRAVVAADTAEAAALLAGADPGRVRSADAGNSPAKVVFLFPGQGAQYPGMGQGLYGSEPVFADAMDECARLLAGPLGLDLRTVLYPDVPAEDGLTHTTLAQPALFATEYALSRLLLSWGVEPDVMVGHSIGEFTAAALSGVLSLADAARLVAVRGRLMQDQPTGAMISVAAAAADIEPLLPPGVSIAAVNAPTLCVASGPHEAVAAFGALLADRGITVRPLHTSHAFHSAMMDPVVEPFTRAVTEAQLASPTRPFVSCVTGEPITAGLAVDPEYWGTHMRRPVRFADAVRTAVGDGPAVLVEVGPGNTLSTLARAGTGTGGPRAAAVTTLRRPDESAEDGRLLRTAVGDIWLFGGAVDWPALHQGPRDRVELPGYPFQRDRYWIEPRGAATGAPALSQVPEHEEPEDGQLTRATRPSTLVTAYVEPADELERTIAGIWEEMFGIAPIGTQDNFFELGGHSLLAIQVLNRLQDTSGVTVELGRLLATPTIGGMAGQLRAAGASAGAGAGDRLATVVPRPDQRYEPFPLTEMQQAQWIGRLSSFDMGGVAPHLYFEFDSRTIETGRLERAWQRVVERHDMLRMVVLPDGRQRVLEEVEPYRFEVLDLRDTEAGEAGRQLAEIRDRMGTEVRPADVWPLWEVRVSLLPGHQVRVHISFDLLVADVSSFFYQLLPQWREFYHEPGHDPAPLTLTFRDYVLAEEELRQTPRYERSLDYWRKRVRELPAAPELPTVQATGGGERLGFVRRHARLDAELWGRIKAKAGEFGVTPSSAMLAAFAVTIGTWSKSQRFTLNFTAVNRLPVHEEVDDLVGEFASFDLLEVDAVSALDFAGLVRELQRQSWADFDHRYVSGVRILRERARARGGAGDVMPVVFTSALGSDVDGKPAPSPVDWLGEQSYFISQTPQVTIDHFLLEFGGNLELAWHAVDGLFPEGMMAEMFQAYQDFVVGLAETEGWHRPPVLDLPAAQLAPRAAANDTAGELPDDVLPARVLARSGSAEPAVITEDRTLDFAELTGRAVALAQELTGAGFGRGAVVGIGLAKGWRQTVAALAASAAGCTYVPLDPGLPEARRRWLVEQAGIGCVLAEPDTEAHWPNAPRVLPVPEDARWDPADVPAWTCPARPDDTAYVIYTSGSTGTPKGVAVSHRAALNTLVDIEERFGIRPGDRALGLSALNFDLSVFDVFGMLAAGGALVLPGTADRRSPDRWTELCRRHGVTVWNSVPALMQMLVEHLESAGDQLPELRLTMLSGDWIPLSLPDRLRAVAPATEVISLGGATEAAVWSIAHPIGEVSPDWSSIPYGRPLRNQRFHVLNDRLRHAPVWVPGHLHIAGAGLAEGYWNDEQRTAESFITHPGTGERLYRTGDLGRYLPDGTIEFLGRDDFQVKIGGYRIELGEIEHVLGGHPGLHSAVVSALGPRTQQRLVAHVVPADPAMRDDPDFAGRLRAHLADTLPSYMIPSDFVLIDEMPLSGNGKVDRSALPDPRRAGGGTTAAKAPENHGEEATGALRTLLVLAADLLGVDRPGARDNFFELGGDSIMGVQFVGRANAEGIPVTPQNLFESADFLELARAVPADAGIGDIGAAVALTPHQSLAHAQTGSVLLDVPDTFDPVLAARALNALADRHPALRTRVRTEDGRRFAVRPDGGEDLDVPEIDLGALPDDVRTESVEQMLGEMAGELDTEAGPTVKLAVFRLGERGSALGCAVAQGLMDDASVLLLCRELALTYERLAAGRPVVWSAGAGSPLAWNRGLRRELAHPAGLAGAPGAPRALPLRRTVGLDAVRTAELFSAAAGSHHLDPAEVLAAAASAALGRALEEPPQLLVERSLRDDLAAGDEPAGRLVGRVTELRTVEPTAAEAPLGDSLLLVKSRLRTGEPLPVRGATVAVRELVTWDRAEGAIGVPADFTGVTGAAGWHEGAVGQLSAAVVDGALRVRWQLDASVTEDGATRLADAFGAVLGEIAEHCREAEEGSYEPSDFPLADLSEDELGEFLDELR